MTVAPDVEGFTLLELAREAEREVVLRQTYYPSLIERKKMRPDQAARRIALMTEIARRLRAEDRGEARQSRGLA